MKSFWLTICCLFCRVPMLLYGQYVADSTAAKDIELAHFPTKVFNAINGRANSLEQGLDRQTTRYLRRMAGQESRLRSRLYALDSGKAAALYAQDPQQQYTMLVQKLRQDSARVFSSMGPQYLPYVDSVQGMLAYLNKNPGILGGNPALTAKLQSSLANLQLLQSKLQIADQIKAFVQSRQTKIQQALAGYSHLPTGITGAVAGYKRQAYYYADQVRAYRAMLNDPDKMMRTALAMLDKLPAFTSFMKQHSFLSGLFGLSADYGTDQGLAGMQTRSQVLAMIQNKVGQGGGSGTAAIQNSLSTAQQDIGNLQNKLSSLGAGSGDMNMPDFKPNNQRTKTFFQRLEYGTYLQTTPATTLYPSYSDIGLSLAYNLGHSNSVGIGASYKLGWGTPLQHIALSSQGVGLRSFVDIHVRKSFSLTGGYELNYLSPFSGLQDIRALSRWKPSGVIGVTKTISLKSPAFRKTQVSFLWDFLSYYQVPKTQPVLFRVGYTF